MAGKKRKVNSSFRKIAIASITALVLMFGTAAIVNNLLSKSQTKASKSVTASINKTTDTPKVEPDITKKEKTEVIPEQGKVDKKPETAPEQNKTTQPAQTQQPVKANQNVIDPLIENYLNIYVNLASDGELEFYYLDNIVLKNSKFYKTLTDEIQKLRQAKLKYTLDDFKVENISKGENESELLVQVSQTISKKTSKYTYTILFDKNGVFIKDRK